MLEHEVTQYSGYSFFFSGGLTAIWIENLALNFSRDDAQYQGLLHDVKLFFFCSDTLVYIAA